MEKKFKFSDNPTVARTVYGAVVAILCISAIIVGIVASNNRRKSDIKNDPPTVNEGNGANTENGEQDKDENGSEGEKKKSYIAPVVGRVTKEHSITVPAYSATLEAWKIHTGIDIMTEESAAVFAVNDGEVTRVYNHPMLGVTVELTHSDGVVSRYSNLSESLLPTVGMKIERGGKIGCVGDSAISELADEAHLHFEMLVSGTSVNPLDYISTEAQSSALGITA